MLSFRAQWAIPIIIRTPPPPPSVEEPLSHVGTSLEFPQIFMENLPLPMEFPCENYPCPWNLTNIRCINSVSSFKTALKTYLFRLAFGS